jgi:hypothetical protein
MMFEHQFKKRRKSTIPEKTSLPKINGGEQRIIDNTRDSEKRLQSVDQGLKEEKHHRDKSKCQICIRKRAEKVARRAAREQQKMLESQE